MRNDIKHEVIVKGYLNKFVKRIFSAARLLIILECSSVLVALSLESFYLRK